MQIVRTWWQYLLTQKKLHELLTTLTLENTSLLNALTLKYLEHENFVSETTLLLAALTLQYNGTLKINPNFIEVVKTTDKALRVNKNVLEDGSIELTLVSEDAVRE
jgi:hypothetical protein